MTQANEINVVMEDSFLKKLREFKKHLNASAMEMLDVINDGGDYEERFDVKIECNGQSISIDLHADIFSRLEGLLDAEIEEYIELKEADANAKS